MAQSLIKRLLGQLVGFDEANIEMVLKDIPDLQVIASGENIYNEAMSVGSIKQASDSDFTMDREEE